MGMFLRKKCLENRYPDFTGHVVHPFALKQNQCIEFVILSGKWIELLLVDNIYSLIAYHKCQLQY